MKRIRANQLAAHKYHFKQITSSMSFKFCNNASPPYMNDVFNLADKKYHYQSIVVEIFATKLVAVFRSSFYSNFCWSKDFIQDLLHRHLKDLKNNHNILLALTFLFTSISIIKVKKFTLKIFSFARQCVKCVIFTMPIVHNISEFH